MNLTEMNRICQRLFLKREQPLVFGNGASLGFLTQEDNFFYKLSLSFSGEAQNLYRQCIQDLHNIFQNRQRIRSRRLAVHVNICIQYSLL